MQREHVPREGQGCYHNLKLIFGAIKEADHPEQHTRYFAFKAQAEHHLHFTAQREARRHSCTEGVCVCKEHTTEKAATKVVLV